MIVEQGLIGNLRLRSEKGLDVMTSDFLDGQIFIQEIRKLRQGIYLVVDGMFAEMVQAASKYPSLACENVIFDMCASVCTDPCCDNHPFRMITTWTFLLLHVAKQDVHPVSA